MPCDSPFFQGFLGFTYVQSDNAEMLERAQTWPGMAMQRRRSVADDCVPTFIGRSYVPNNNEEGGRNLSHGLYNWCCNYHRQQPLGGRAPCQQGGVHMISSSEGPAVYCGQGGAQPIPIPPSSEFGNHGACVAMCNTGFPLVEECGVGEDVGYDFGLQISDPFDECESAGFFNEWSTQVEGDILNHGVAAKREYYQCCYEISRTFFDAQGPYVVTIQLQWRTNNCQTDIYCLGIEVTVTRETKPALRCRLRNSGLDGIPWDCYSDNPPEGEPASGHWEGPVEFPPPEGEGQIWPLYNVETQNEAGWFIFRAHVN